MPTNNYIRYPFNAGQSYLDAHYLRLDGTNSPSANINLAGNSLVGNSTSSGNLLLSSTSNATKGYVGVTDGSQTVLGNTTQTGTTNGYTLLLDIGTCNGGAAVYRMGKLSQALAANSIGDQHVYQITGTGAGTAEGTNCIELDITSDGTTQVTGALTGIYHNLSGVYLADSGDVTTIDWDPTNQRGPSLNGLQTLIASKRASVGLALGTLNWIYGDGTTRFVPQLSIGCGNYVLGVPDTAGYKTVGVIGYVECPNTGPSNLKAAGVMGILGTSPTITQTSLPNDVAAGIFDNGPVTGSVPLLCKVNGTKTVSIAHGLQVSEAANGKQGGATLVAGTVTVSNTNVTSASRIFLTTQSLGTVTAPKAIAVTAIVPGTSFTITSADNTDTSVVAYEIFEPA